MFTLAAGISATFLMARGGLRTAGAAALRHPGISVRRIVELEVICSAVFGGFMSEELIAVLFVTELNGRG